ncbi:hypothetical protein GlitD10_0604 [Gloeomargarita lithophora Alchichica-D10]|uniref:Uncharacterized protein n=1 Tax=Gloeomargarita lithophora Alchichica-D10 TaxID=1188229 RepID=A0A1J0AAG3_9CYAN|nr:hypothetical protein [Gloeomargarita lithophora]APB32918.1 hypothetical protein GlitD10_0604 [Gloeomargarita lithophora Alchichica-D10]
MAELPSPNDFGLDITDLESWLTPAEPPLEMGGDLDAFFAEPSPAEPLPAETGVLNFDLDESPPPPLPTSEVALFDWPEVPPPSRTELPVPASRELTLPPLISPQGLWAEIGHLFQTPAFSESVVESASDPHPLIKAEIDALSQAMLANDGDTIQTLVHQIQQTHDDLQSIEIFLVATRNLLYS